MGDSLLSVSDNKRSDAGSPFTAAPSRVPEGRHGGRRQEGHQHEERDLAAVILKAQKEDKAKGYLNATVL